MPSCLSVKVTPLGRLPDSVIAGVGEPVVVTVKLPAVPTTKAALLTLVIAGACVAADEQLGTKQVRAVLDAVLDELLPEQRVVFALFELDGMSAEEIATLVEAPLNTVYSRLRLARAHFEKGVARRRAGGEL